MLVSLYDFKSLESLTSITPSTTHIPNYHIMTLGWSVGSSGLGDFVVTRMVL